jgi:hypothetical protein
VREQRLDEAGAAVHRELRAVVRLQRGDVLGDVALDERGVVPFDPVERGRGDVLAHGVQLVRDRALVVRPMRGEDLVRAAPEHQLVRPRPVRDGLPHDVVEIRDRPAAVREAAGGVLLRTAGRLHDAVE